MPRKWRAGPASALVVAFVERFNSTRVGVKPLVLECVTAQKQTGDGWADADLDVGVDQGRKRVIFSHLSRGS